MSANKLIYKGFTGSFDASLEDECLVGKVLFIDDIVTYEGDMVPELKANFQAAVDRYLAYCEKTGKAANKPYSGTFNVRVGSDLHRQAAIAAQDASINLNEYMARATQAAVEQAPTAMLAPKTPPRLRANASR